MLLSMEDDVYRSQMEVQTLKISMQEAKLQEAKYLDIFKKEN